MKRISIPRCLLCLFAVTAANLLAEGAWTIYPSGTVVDLNRVQFFDSQTGWIWGKSGVLLSTSDGGETWRNRSCTSVSPFGGMDFIDGQTGWVFRTFTIEDDPDHYWISSVFKTSNCGKTWDSLCANTDYQFRDMQFAGPDTGFAIAEQFVHKFFVLRTTDGGVTWLPSFSQDFQETGPRLLSVIDSRHVWAVYKQSDGESQWRNFISTTDGGETWNGSSVRPDESHETTIEEVYSLFFLDAAHGWASAHGSIRDSQALDPVYFGEFLVQTSDSGAHWTLYHPSQAMKNLFFVTDQAGWGIADGSAIHQTLDSGQSWTLHDSIPDAGLNDLTFTPSGQGWAVGNDGLILKCSQPFGSLQADFSADSTNGIGSMEVQFTDLSAGTVTSWLWDFGDGATSTEQNPVHVFTVPDTFTVMLTVTGPAGMDTKIIVDLIMVQATDQAAWKQGLPDTYALFPAYPNPFNRKTQFRFSLPVESHVRFEITDIRGNPVERLNLDQRPAGYHSAEWDPGDAPSGIYMVRILAGSFTQVQKCVLIK